MGILSILINLWPRPGLGRLRQGLRWLAPLLALLLVPGSGVCETSLGEYSLKAAFIFNFSKFVEWPENAFHNKRDFCIATLGRSPLDRELAALSGKTVQGRSIVFRKLTSVDDASQCQVLFVGRAEMPRLDAILDALRDQPVLTIAESEDFCKKGGMLSLEKENGKIVFEVNYREALRARLKPTAQLLKLARKIHGRP